MSIDILSKRFLKEYLSRNKSLIILSVAIFFLSIISGIVFSRYFEEMALAIIKKMLEDIDVSTISDTAWSLFSNNILANINIMLGGLLFSLLSVFAVILNGILIGYVYTLTNPFVYIVSLVPHGIFEVPALILSLTGAFILTKMELNIIRLILNKSLRKDWRIIKGYLKDVLFTFIVTFVLLVFAAVIESSVTPYLLGLV